MMAVSGFKVLLKSLSRPLLISFILTGTSLLVLGQTTTIQTTTPTSAPHSTIRTTPADRRTHADETFELNIVERRYSQETFAASTAVGTTGDAQKLDLQVGVSLASGRIDVQLRQVHGTVRFRGNLDRILGIISDRQSATPANSPAPSPAPSPE